MCLEACRKECAFYQEHGKLFLQHHLENRKRIALKQVDKEVFQKISAIIQRKQQQNSWRKLNYMTGKKKTCSTSSIQVEGSDGIIMECTTQETVKQTIFLEIHEKRYMLEGEVPTELKVLLTLSGTLTSLLNTPLRSRPRLP